MQNCNECQHKAVCRYWQVVVDSYNVGELPPVKDQLLLLGQLAITYGQHCKEYSFAEPRIN